MSYDQWPSNSTATDVTFSSLGPRNGSTSVTTASGSSDNGRSSRSEPREYVLPSGVSYAAGSGSRQAPNAGGFLLGSPYKTAEKRGKGRQEKAKSQVGQLRSERNSLRVPRMSEESSHGSSPLSREISADYSTADGSASGQQSQMDPAQLVRMALDLSESRKRNVSGSLQGTLPQPPKFNQPGARYGSVRSASKRDTSMRADWQQSSPSPRDSEHMRTSFQPQASDVNSDLSFDFSPATLSRAEKARKYFELADEYRKLLKHLPPINDHDNGQSAATERAYNPLQSLRNRRLRTREKRPYTAPTETWQDLDIVKDWIANVESTSSGDRKDQDLQLPTYPGDSNLSTEARGIPLPTGHRRTNTVNSTIMRPENGWTVDPSELLADAYWTGQKGNRFLLEDNKGDRIVTSRLVLDDSQKTSDTVHAEFVDGEHKEPSKRGTRRHTLLQKPFPHSRAPSMSSVSSNEAQNPLPVDEDDARENTGPLERHMQEMIHKEERGELSSPEISPDKWESNHNPYPSFHNATTQEDHNVTSNLSVESAFQHRRAQSADTHTRNIAVDAMSSAEGLNSDEPNSPVVPGFVPSMGMDLNSPPRETSPIRQHKSRFHRLPKFRGHSKERNNIQQTDFASQQSRTSLESSRHSHQTHKQTESWGGSGSQRRNETKNSIPRTSLESSRPSFQRHRPTESWGGSLRRQETNGNGSVKESSSTVGRFFKGGRIGELVRIESSRLGDRMRGKDDNAIERWDDDNGVTSGDSETSPRTSIDRGRTRPRYNVPTLPSFKSPAVMSRDRVDSDPIGRQQRAQRDAARPPRFGNLSIYPPGDEGTSQSNRKSNSHDSLTSLGGPPPISIPHAAKLRQGEQRHWSISDRRQSEHDNKITMRDVARVKALLLSSGIKAREIQRSADRPRSDPLLMIQKVSELVGRQLNPVSKRDEHQVAARALTDELNKSLSEFENTLSTFQSGTARSLASELDELQQKASDQLSTLVHDTSDEADAFTVELTTRQPQDIKRIDDAIDNMLRRRRRQFRVLRRTGFKLLEWMVLGIMWWIWFIVVLFNTMRKLGSGAVSFVKWLVWF